MKQPIQAGDGHRQKATTLIYLVDDEPLLLDLAEMALKGNGYLLKKFQNPELALKSFVRARAKPVLIITDYAMGRVNGCDFLASCKQVDPTVKTLLVSGTVGPEIVLNAPVTIDRFLAKPYQPETLADLVRAVLAT